LAIAAPARQLRNLADGFPCASRRNPSTISSAPNETPLAEEGPGARTEEGGEQAALGHEASIGSEFAKLHGIPRIPELPRLHEERSLECTFQVTFLVPFGPEGRNFMENIRAAFGEAPSALAASHTVSANSDKSFVLVPYAGSRTALVLLQDIGPVRALEHVRLRSRCSSRDLAKSGKAQPEALPEPTNEMCARSTALVYVVHAAQCMDGLERQLGPICSVEAFYAAAGSEFLPQRSIVALQEPESGSHVFEAPDPLVPPTARLRGQGSSDTEEIIRQLQHRRVPRLPCTNVRMRDRESHRNLLLHLVNSLASDFCLSARENADIPRCTKAIDFFDTDTVTPLTNLSRTSSPKTTPSSSMLSAAHDSPRLPERSGACIITSAGAAHVESRIGWNC
jgi:hypothetical protein